MRIYASILIFLATSFARAQSYSRSMEEFTPWGGTATSAHYAVRAISADFIGGPSVGPNLRNDVSYAGQFCTLQVITLSAGTTNILESTTEQIRALALYDDGSVAPVERSCAWGIVTGPIEDIGPAGLLLAAAVTTSTAARIQVVCDGVTGQLGLMILNNMLEVSNQTQHLTGNWDTWIPDRITGHFRGQLTFCNRTASGRTMTEPFWIAIPDSEAFLVYQADGETLDGDGYKNGTAQVLAQLGDGELNAGDCVIVTNIQVYPVWGKVPPAHLAWQVWSAGRPADWQADSDNDGIPDDYEIKYSPLLDRLDPTDALLDFDDDGMSNLAESIANTNPGDGSSLLELTAIGSDAERRPVVSWLSASNRTYTVYWSTNRLENFVPLSPGLAGTPDVNVFTNALPAEGNAIFFRIGVQR